MELTWAVRKHIHRNIAIDARELSESKKLASVMNRPEDRASEGATTVAPTCGDDARKRSAEHIQAFIRGRSFRHLCKKMKAQAFVVTEVKKAIQLITGSDPSAEEVELMTRELQRELRMNAMS